MLKHHITISALTAGATLFTVLNTAWAVSTNETYTVSCGTGGSAVLTAHPSGQTSTIPLAVGWLGVTGLYNPPKAELQAENSATFVPTSDFPVYARRGSAFTTRVFVYPPGNWPVSLTESATMNGVTWNAPVAALTAHLDVAGFELPKGQPNGSPLSISVTATDACGSVTQTWPDVVTLAGRPVWDFTTLGS